jgi:hypothetical protein
MLLIAYPNKDQETEFEFTYWVEPYEKTVFQLAIEFDFDGPDGAEAKKIVEIVGVSVSSILVCCILFICYKLS